MRKWIVSLVIMLAMGGISGEVMAQQVKTKPNSTAVKKNNKAAVRKKAAARKTTTASQQRKVTPQRATANKVPAAKQSGVAPAQAVPSEAPEVKAKPTEARKPAFKK